MQTMSFYVCSQPQFTSISVSMGNWWELQVGEHSCLDQWTKQLVGWSLQVKQHTEQLWKNANTFDDGKIGEKITNGLNTKQHMVRLSSLQLELVSNILKHHPNFKRSHNMKSDLGKDHHTLLSSAAMTGYPTAVVLAWLPRLVTGLTFILDPGSISWSVQQQVLLK